MGYEVDFIDRERKNILRLKSFVRANASDFIDELERRAAEIEGRESPVITKIVAIYEITCFIVMSIRINNYK